MTRMRKAIESACVLGILVWTVSAIVRQASILVPLTRSGQDVTYGYLWHLQRSLMLRPFYGLSWAILVVTGVALTWPTRDDWRTRPRRLYVFLGCSFSILWFLCIVIFVH